MTFPTVPTVAAGRVLFANQADTSSTRTFPSLTGLTKNSGDLLVAIVVGYQSSLTSAIFSAWGASFSEIRDIGVSSQHCVGVAYKISDGTETGAFTVTQAGTVTGHATLILLSIPDAHGTTAPEVSAALATGTSSAADPASLNPAGWDVEDTLWVSVVGSGMTSGTGSWTGTGTTAPTNYTDRADSNTTDNSTVGQTEAAVAFRQLAAASEDVGTAGVDTSNARNCAFVIAVRPAPAPEQHDGALTATGGGVAMTSGQKDAQVSTSATGGGVGTLNGQKAVSSAIAATGAGVSTTIVTTDRPSSLTATGGGVAAFEGLAEEGSTDLDGVLTATGGGVAALEATTDRASPLVATASANLSAAHTTNRDSALAATGGGSWAANAETARQGAALLSGGGVLTLAQATERFGAFAATGGGEATFAGSSAEDHPGTIVATGGGIATFAGDSQRSSSVAATGGGAWTNLALSARLGGLTASGGGVGTFAQMTERTGALVGTGEGTATFGGSSGSGGFPNGTSGVLTMTAAATATVSLVPAPTAEVT